MFLCIRQEKTPKGCKKKKKFTEEKDKESSLAKSFTYGHKKSSLSSFELKELASKSGDDLLSHN